MKAPVDNPVRIARMFSLSSFPYYLVSGHPRCVSAKEVNSGMLLLIAVSLVFADAPCVTGHYILPAFAVAL